MKLKKEIPLLLVVLIPFLYLAFIWNSLPETIPTHWNIKGEIDGWGKKSILIWVTFLLPVLTYIILTAIPFLDPKKKIESMGNKFYDLKFLLVLFMSALSIFIIYITKKQSMTNMNFLFAGLGILYILMGNYMKTIKANYFIGIRTPWTLENESVWKSTHILAGKLWFAGGFIVILSSLLTSKEFNGYFFLSITILLALIPVVYSYAAYKKIKA
ncbi:SdpI family protein [Flavobacteriaceae bacterium XHP0103]|uniref:SdpI family protein n=1 Tax=Marixanthotalea marina TaxID=2844359 RepID=UPI002989F154|nr:SdpI family protein [Marixanthotalea marina]MBU3821205.1 SdpI family protein [Marixanthotalea marina]